MQAHQEAFTIWRKLILHAHHDTVGEVVREGQEWWDKNCLYLSAEAREAFNRSYFAAASHRLYLKAARRGAADVQVIQKNWGEVMRAGSVLLQAVDLPSLGEAEVKDATKPPADDSAAPPRATAA